jgi:hypothetical protein
MALAADGLGKVDLHLECDEPLREVVEGVEDVDNGSSSSI